MSADLTLAVRLQADGSDLVGEVRIANREIGRLTEGLDKSDTAGKRAGRGMQAAAAGARRLRNVSQSLYQQLFSLKGIMAGLGVGLVSRSFIEAANTSEQYRVRLKVLLGSQAEGNRLFREMADYASRVPFQYEEIMGAATQLSGVMNGGVDQIKEWMPLIGDLAATSGLSIQQTTEQVIRMYSAGAGAADLFRERGITAMLGFQAGVSYSAEETRQKLMEEWTRTGSQFRGATEELSRTWAGSMSMLSDKWFQFRNQVMDGGLFDYLKAVITVIDKDFGEAVTGSKREVQGWSEAIISGAEAMLKPIGWIADGIHGIRIVIQSLELGWKAFLFATAAAAEDLVEMLDKIVNNPIAVKFFGRTDLGLDKIRADVMRFGTDLDAARGELSKLLLSALPSAAINEKMREFRQEYERNLKEVTISVAGAKSALVFATREEADAFRQEQEWIARVREEMTGSTEATRELIDTNKDLDGSAEAVKKLTNANAALAESINPVAQIYRDTATTIRRSFRDTFRDVFANGIRSFKDLGTRISEMFKNLLADLATLAIARPVIVPVVSAVGGMMGVSQTAQAQVLGQLGLSAATGAAGSMISGAVGYGANWLAGVAGGAGGQQAAMLAAQTGEFGLAGAQATNAALGGIGPAGASLAGLGIAGLAGGLLGSTAGGYGSAGGSIGAMAGMVLGGPIGAAIGAVLGSAVGSLFGSKWETKNYGVELDYQGGSVTGRDWQEQKRRRLWRTKKRTIYGDVDPELSAALDASLATVEDGVRRLASGFDLAVDDALLAFSARGRISVKGLSAQEIKARLEQWVRDTGADLLAAAMPDLAPLIRRAGDKQGEIALALLDVGRYIGGDLAGDFAASRRLAGRTAWQAAADQADGLRELLAAYDGSLAATRRLAAATQERYQTELQLLGKIQQALDGITGQYNASIERVRMDVMTDAERYAWRADSIDALVRQLAAITDPAQVSQLAGQIDRLTMENWQSLSAAQQQALADQYTTFLTDVRDTAASRLEAARAQVEQTNAAISDAVRESLTSAARQQIAAAREQADAAQTLQTAASALQQAVDELRGGSYYSYG